MRRILPLLLLLAAVPAHASELELHDGAYGPEPVGGGLKGPESVIHLAREHLTIALGRQAADVVATYTFINTLPTETAHQLVGFPDLGAAGAEAARRRLELEPYDGAKPLEDARTAVNDRPVPATLKYGFVKPNADGPGWGAGKPGDLLMAWDAVPVEFPPGKEVKIARRFRAPMGENVFGVTAFRYVTHTGGVWQGPIGGLVVDVSLKDGLTTQDLVWPGDRIPASLGAGIYPDSSVTRPAKGAWQLQDATHLRLAWATFEPRTQPDRAGFALVARGS